MNDFNIDKYLDIGILFTEEKENVWDKEKQIKPEYWALIDINNDKIIEFNKTSEKDFVIGNMITKNLNNQQKEISKYTIEKTLQYKNYLIEDIKTGQTPLQKKLSSVLGNDKDKTIDKDKLKLCIEIMNNYYDSVVGLDNFLNLN